MLAALVASEGDEFVQSWYEHGGDGSPWIKSDEAHWNDLGRLVYHPFPCLGDGIGSTPSGGVGAACPDKTTVNYRCIAGFQGFPPVAPHWSHLNGSILRQKSSHPVDYATARMLLRLVESTGGLRPLAWITEERRERIIWS